MPFLKGAAPIRRTWKYLESGKLIFKETVKIMTINYNPTPEPHRGAKEFTFWYIPQIQYKNPDVQILIFKNLTPSALIRCFLDNGEQVVMDVDSKDKDEIQAYLKKMLGKSDEVLAAETVAREIKSNPANFGRECDRHCICENPGQVPCPSIIHFPKHMRGKYTLTGTMDQ